MNMLRHPSLSGSEAKSVNSRASELSGLSDEECKRILSVIERDFQVRQKEFKRLDDIKRIVKQESERVEYLSKSTEFTQGHCIRCFKPFRVIINPRETCSECKKFVCHDCSTYSSETKAWACNACIKLKELNVLTTDWFYTQTSKKHKRCGSAKVVRELHKREKDLADLDQCEEESDFNNLPPSEWRNSGSVIPYESLDKNVKIELKEYSTRLTALVEKLEEDLSERNAANAHRTLRGKSKEGLKDHQEQIKTEISRARIALSGPLRRSNTKTNTTHERDLQNLLIQQTEVVIQTSLDQFHQSLTAPKSTINENNFDQKLAQIIFDKCVGKEIIHELPDIIDTSERPSIAPAKPQRQSSTTSSLTSLTKPSTFQPALDSSSTRNSNSSFEIKSRNGIIRKVNVPRNTTVDEEDTEKEDEDQERTPRNNIKKRPITKTTTDSIQFDNGLKLDLSSIDGDITDQNNRRHSNDYDYDAINRSNARVGDWQTNFTLIEPRSPSYSGEDTLHNHRESILLTIPASDKKDLSPRIGDKPLEDLADDDLYADDQSSSYPNPINTATIGEHSQTSDNDITHSRKLFPLPANLVLQNHSSCSFRRPSYTYESDNESITSSLSNLTDMKPSIDEEKFRMDPNILDPKFLIRPKDITIRNGETAKFKVKVSGTEPIDVFWFRFGTDEEIVNDEKYQLSHDDLYHYLKIYSTNKDDEGAYLCVIANDKAQNVDIVKLCVKDNKRSFTQPKILQEYLDTDVNEGLSLTLKCKIDHGYPKSRVLWYKENTLIQPNEHYKLYYYGDGQYALHVDETTIEDDNRTFTCLALNAAGRVQITADVFVHEKEVIDIPRNSPLFLHPRNIQKKPKLEKKIINMADDDNPPEISPPVSPILRTNQLDKEDEHNAKRFMDKFKNDRTSNLLENWQNLYESSVNSLQAGDDQIKLTPHEPFYLNRRPSIEQPLDEKPRSPTFYPRFDSNSTKPKWEIRLPQLLNTTVGPDRQQRDSARRHTTQVVLQKEQQSGAFSPINKEPNSFPQSFSTSQMSNHVDHNRPTSPLVKQLKQKFDRMTENNEYTQSQTPRVGNDEGNGAYPLLPDDEYSWIDENNDEEVASLTRRGLMFNNIERQGQKVRPILPTRPLNETNPINTNPSSLETYGNTNYYYPKGKPSPPISYQKNINHTRSTTSVVKQLIGDGATLVYDSLTPDSTPHTTPSLLQHHFYPNHHYQKQRKEHVRLKQANLTSTNQNLLTVTPIEFKTENTTNTKTRNRSVTSDNDEEKNNQKHLKSTKNSLNRSTSMSDNLTIQAKSMQIKPKQTSFDSIKSAGKKTVLARAELWDRRISTNESEINQPVEPYDIEQWSNEFEKIQIQNQN